MSVTRKGCFPSFFAAVRPPKPPPTMTTCGTVPGSFCLCPVTGDVPGCVEFVSVKVLRPFPSGSVNNPEIWRNVPGTREGCPYISCVGSAFYDFSVCASDKLAHHSQV